MMCDPTTMMVMQIASTAAGVVAQQQKAEAQAAANQRQYDNQMRAFRENIAQTNIAQQQEREAAMQKQEQNNMAARQGMARSQVAAGESGITGLSVDHLLMSLSGKQTRYNSSVETNYRRAEASINNQRENVSTQTASAINSLKTPDMPDYLGAGLKIGNTVYDYDQKYNSGKWFG